MKDRSKVLICPVFAAVSLSVSMPALSQPYAIGNSNGMFFTGQQSQQRSGEAHSHQRIRDVVASAQEPSTESHEFPPAVSPQSTDESGTAKSDTKSTDHSASKRPASKPHKAAQASSKKQPAHHKERHQKHTVSHHTTVRRHQNRKQLVSDPYSRAYPKPTGKPTLQVQRESYPAITGATESKPTTAYKLDHPPKLGQVPTTAESADHKPWHHTPMINDGTPLRERDHGTSPGETMSLSEYNAELVVVNLYDVTLRQAIQKIAPAGWRVEMALHQKFLDDHMVQRLVAERPRGEVMAAIANKNNIRINPYTIQHLIVVTKR